MYTQTLEGHRGPYVKRLTGMLAVVLVFAQMLLQSAAANTTAKNRNDVYRALSELNAELELNGLDIWINENAENPSVNIGDRVFFTMTSAEPAFYTLVHVDSKGSTSIVKVGSSGTGDGVVDPVVYPPLIGGCREYKLDPTCFDPNNGLVQFEPIGQDAVFLLASKQPILDSVLGMLATDNFKLLGKDMTEIEGLVQRLNRQADDNPIAVLRYTYSVDSPNTQYTARSISKKVNRVADGIDESIVFNNINFAFNSSVLTVPGRIELDGLGSALVLMEEELGQIPTVELTGHTDSIGPEAYNITLSRDRAESAKQYLVWSRHSNGLER